MLDLSISLPPRHLDALIETLKAKHPPMKDPWGLDFSFTRKVIASLYPFYKHYFKVRVLGKHHIKDRPYIIVANHTGQLAFDGALISMAFALEMNPPRIIRPMIERFVPGIPFIGDWLRACGAVLGERQNCLEILNRGESALVFPEGLSGIAKDTKDFYKLQKFTKGFLRMAIEAKVEILPVAVVGAEECYPFVHHSKKIASFFHLPTFPITPTFPLLGPLGIIPLPSPIDIHLGKPIAVPPELNLESSDEQLEIFLHQIEKEINSMIKWGLNEKRSMAKAHLPTIRKKRR